MKRHFGVAAAVACVVGAAAPAAALAHDGGGADQLRPGNLLGELRGDLADLPVAAVARR